MPVTSCHYQTNVSETKATAPNEIDEYLLQLGGAPVIPSRVNQDAEERVLEFDQ